MGGWIKVHRDITNNPLWSDKPFSKGQAWIDILLMANHQDRDIILGNDVVHVERGSFITSELKLMQRWGWSKSKVRTYIRLLKNAEQIDYVSDTKKTTITVVNYNVYQNDAEEKDHGLFKIEPIKDRLQDNGKTSVNAEYKGNGECIEPQKDRLQDHGKTTERPQTVHKQEERKKYKKGISKDIPKKDESFSKQISLIRESYNSVCGSYPRLTKMSDSRIKAIKARLNTGYTGDDFQKVFEMAEASDFLKGKNNRNWSATFDWLIKDSNMAKVLDGNYDNPTSGGKGGFKPRNTDLGELEKALLERDRNKE